MPDRSNKLFLGVSDFGTAEPLQNADRIIAAGMDFIEPGLAKAAAMSTADFEATASAIQSSGIEVLSMNWFLPPSLKVTGPDVDEKNLLEFLNLALSRAETLGAKAVVFGSPSSRSLPDGVTTEKGKEQLVAFCNLCADVIEHNDWGMKIALEHVNHTETNFINTFADALEIVRLVDRAPIGLAADFYHFAMENESTDVLHQALGLVCAVQLADPSDRCFPKVGCQIPGLEGFITDLIESGYEGGISVEANVGESLETDCRDAVQLMTKLIKQLG